MSFPVKYTKEEAYAKAKKEWLTNVEELDRLTKITSTPDNRKVLTLEDRRGLKNVAAFLREPYWDTRMNEKLFYDVQVLMGKDDLSSDSKLKTLSDQKAKPADSQGMAKMSGMAVLSAATFTLNIDASQSELTDGMGSYEFVRGKQSVSFKNGRGFMSNKLTVVSHNTKEEVMSTTREILMVQKNNNPEKTTTSRVRREPTYAELEQFSFANYNIAGCKNQQEVLVSRNQNGKVTALCNVFNGFVHHPYHIGLGDHMNAAQVVDVCRQSCNVFLNSTTHNPEEYIYSYFEVNFVSFNELSVPLEIQISGHKATTDAKNRVFHSFEVTVRQEPRLCSTMKCTLMPLRNLFSAGGSAKL
eukprot:TRINITY_DN24624_c0_g1_i1.p1 TRINITY_DN24624_c0_g1~~TRINITY_DN24624_c0_g1_i1.p1  ORF type:complete len:357 (+),score=47.38 TRINITY_DN24624_c0_g1_i1:38-1108(+)